MKRRRSKSRLDDHDVESCAEIRDRVDRARRQVDAAVARGDAARTVTRLRSKVRAFESTMTAMGCRTDLGRPRRRRRR